MRCSALQCVAVCCSVLQLQCVALQFVAARSSVLQCVVNGGHAIYKVDESDFSRLCEVTLAY